MYRFNNNLWEPDAYIKAPSVANNYQFGASVAIDHNLLIVGSPGEASDDDVTMNGPSAYSTDTSAAYSGAAYIYERTSSGWVQRSFLKAHNSDAGDSFGRSVAICGRYSAVTADGESSTSNTIENGGTTATANNLGGGNGASYIFSE